MATIYDTTKATNGVSDIELFDNEVVQTKIKSALNTALDMMNFATVDYSLSAAPGMQISVRTYTPSGEAERLVMGNANTTYVGTDFTEADYRVKLFRLLLSISMNRVWLILLLLILLLASFLLLLPIV